MGSTTQLSKISKTKKRLSRDSSQIELIVIAFLGVFAIMIAMFRTVSLGREYGVVGGTIPIVAAAQKATSDDMLSPQTPIIVLTENAFYLATAHEYRNDFYNPKNKFKVDHLSGRPQVSDLVDLYRKWSFAKTKTEMASANVVLVPKGVVPMSVVIQVMAMFKQRSGVERIVLGTGMF